MSLVKHLFRALLVTLPWPLRKRVLIRLYGYTFGINSSIGFSFVYPRRLQMGDGARIGHLTFAIGVDYLCLGKNALIGNLNWISGARSKLRPPGFAQHTELSLGEESSITNRHYIDVKDRISIGAYTTIAGVRSVILTHGIDYTLGRQVSDSITIGDYCLIGSNAVILPGAVLDSKVVVGAGAIIPKGIYLGPALYAGCPIVRKKGLTSTEAYFVRKQGYVE